MPLETALPQWEDGQRRLRSADPQDRAVLEYVTGKVVDELRRRLGGPFTAQELVELYDRGTSWCADVALTAAPEHPQAWDTMTVGDAAFARYLREASDFAGGRLRLSAEDAA